MNIKELAEQAGLDMTYPHCIEGTVDDLERFAELVAAAERESCAKLLETFGRLITTQDAAAAIRSRGDKHE